MQQEQHTKHRPIRFASTDDQRQLQDSANRFVAGEYAFEAWQQRTRAGETFSESAWLQMAEMGWMGLGIPEELGGLGLGPRDRAAVMEAVGRGLVLEPYWSSAVLCAELVLALGSAQQQNLYLPRIADGSLRMAFADTETTSRWDLSRISCKAELGSDGSHRITGHKVAVLDAAHAHLYIVVAKDSSGALAAFVVPADAQGITRKDGPTVDARSCSDIRFDGVLVQSSLGRMGAAADGIALAKDRATVALCAEALGAMSMLVDDTIAYLKTRRQFGSPLADFQVLRHRIVDMFVAAEQSRSLFIMAAESLELPADARTRAVSAAKWQVGAAGRFIGENAVQLHGGIGLTDELSIGHYFKRLMAIDTLMGNAEFHLARFSSISESTKA